DQIRPWTRYDTSLVTSEPEILVPAATIEHSPLISLLVKPKSKTVPTLVPGAFANHDLSMPTGDVRINVMQFNSKFSNRLTHGKRCAAVGRPKILQHRRH